MSTGAVIALVIIVIGVVAVLGAAMWMLSRRRHLRDRFGPEYDRMVESGESRRAVERELRDRERRHNELELKPLPPRERERYAKEWVAVQENFVDTPTSAVHDADNLVTRLMRDRGYPTEGYEQQVRHLSVEHGHTLEHYREAHEITNRAAAKEATTEDLRGAMVHYRAVFEDLLTRAERTA
ncbi:hypothetical protein OG216_42330 [Streptomycetaceae bacterium NBC_01309]